MQQAPPLLLQALAHHLATRDALAFQKHSPVSKRFKQLVLEESHATQSSRVICPARVPSSSFGSPRSHRFSASLRVPRGVEATAISH